VLHGEAREGGDVFRDAVQRRLRADSSWSPTAERPTVVVSTALVDDVALFGGAGLVLTRR
jgi:glucokinase